MEPEAPQTAPVPAATPRTSARWSPTVRRWILTALVIALLFVLYWIREIMPVLILSLLLAYLLNPLVVLLRQRLRISRVLATALIYLAFVALLIGIAVTVVPLLFRQVQGLFADLDVILLQVDAILRQLTFLEALGIHIDSTVIANQLRAEVTTLASYLPRILIGALSGAFTTIVVLVLSFYLLKDAEWIGASIDNAVPAEYKDEMQRIKTELGNTWSNFLRGQIILAIIIGVVTTTILTLLGVRNALLLGLLAGVLEVVPTIGPIIASIPAVLIAFFQGSSHWSIENTTFAGVVIIAYILIQQLENHLIVPNVLGSSVNLPPVVILFGALAGASLAGVLGIFLAAPVLATARLVLQFVVRKLFEPVPPKET